MMREIDVLAAQVDELGRLLDELGEDDWARPTRCPPMSVIELAVHVVNVLPFWMSFLEARPDAATTDRVQWWRYDPAAESPKILARAQRGAEGKTPSGVMDEWRESSGALLASYRAEPADRLVGRGSAALTLSDLACIGVVEVGVHSMDLGHATLRGERIHADAVPIVVEVLEGLAGEAMPPALGWSPRTFILCGTGRRALSPTEERVLAGNAGKFPLLA